MTAQPDNIISSLRFDAQGLIPAVVTDVHTRELLMVAYMNKESLQNTLTEKVAIFYSRSRNKLWRKGDTSGNVLKVKNIIADCDCDCLQIIAEVQGDGKVCHTGASTCFFNKIM